MGVGVRRMGGKELELDTLVLISGCSVRHLRRCTVLDNYVSSSIIYVWLDMRTYIYVNLSRLIYLVQIACYVSII